MSKCSFMLGDNGRLDKFTRQARDRCIREVIEPMARDGLRTISVAYRDFVLGKAEINQVIMQNCLGKRAELSVYLQRLFGSDEDTYFIFLELN